MMLMIETIQFTQALQVCDRDYSVYTGTTGMVKSVIEIRPLPLKL